MTNIIILKGERNSGKTITLRDYLPLQFNLAPPKRVFYYRGIKIRVLNKSIHENKSWRDTINSINSLKYDIYVVAAWSDHLIQNSLHIKRKVQDILSERPGIFSFHEVFTEIVELSQQQHDHERCAQQIKTIINGLA
jgi:hypothetical protein